MSSPPAALPRGLLRFGAPPASTTRRLYCLPFAGGGPSTYRLWHRAPAAADIDVVAAVYPGRDPSDRRMPIDTVSEIVAAVRATITELQDEDPRPFALFGHSMGALIAYELTLAMEADGSGPGHLFVSGRRPADELHLSRQYHGLDDDEFLEAIQVRYGGIPEAVRNEPELLALLLPALRADIKAFETYSPVPDRHVACALRVYGGADDGNPRPAQLGGWRRVAGDRFSVRVFPGDHFYLNDARDELVADIAAHW